MASMKKTSSAVRRAIQAGGGPRVLAPQFNVTQQAVIKWRSQGKVPAERVLRLEELTGVSRHELRPDIYPRDAL